MPPETPSETSNVDRKIAELMEAVDSLPKNGYNEFHRYSYIQEADILRAIRPTMIRLKLLFLTSVKGANRQGDVTEVTTSHTFVDTETGETRTVEWYGSEKGDKAPWKTITGNTKQAIQKALLLPSGDDPEKDDEPTKPAARNGTARNGPHRNGTNGKKPPEKPTAPPEPPPAPTPSRAPTASTPAQQAEIRKLAKELDIKDIPAMLTSLGMKSPITKEQAEKVLTHLNAKRLEHASGNGKK